MLLLLAAVHQTGEFQSTPDREAGRCPRQRPATTAAWCWFQSTPDREAGRCATAASAVTMSVCFNPRPTVRPGDARHRPAARALSRVSIHARP